MADEKKSSNRREAPALEDALGVERYAQGLARFIESAPTPLTIALQGDWGSGKTTLFNLMKKDIVDREKEAKAKTRFVELNTWQASVGGLGDCLSQVLVEKIAAELGDTTEEVVTHTFNVVRGLAATLRGLGIAGGSALEILLHSQLLADAVKDVVNRGADAVEGMGDADANAETQDEVQKAALVYDQLSSLKQTIAEGVKKSIDGKKFSRLVVFVDDLDRLEPREAVTLLEGMKNFMDCEGCVFVLALDEEVVFAGVEEKYGKDTRIDYSRRFFDKIIQVPFSMPVASYDVKMYVDSLFDDADDNKTSLFADVIARMWQDGTPGETNNPRSIKRYLLLHSLYMQILDAEVKRSKWGAVEESCLLGMLILRDRSKTSFNNLCAYFHDDDMPKELPDELGGDDLITSIWEWATEENDRKSAFEKVARALAKTLAESGVSISDCLKAWRKTDPFWAKYMPEEKKTVDSKVYEALKEAKIVKHPEAHPNRWATTTKGRRLGLVDAAFGEKRLPYVTVGKKAQQEGSEFQKLLRELLEAKAK